MGHTIYNNTEDKIPVIWSLIPTVTALSISAMGMRLFTRLRRKGLGCDDWLALAATVVCLMESLILLLQVPHGFGRHIYDLPPTMNPALAGRGFWTAQFIYFIALGLLKCSILCFYFRIIPWLRVQIWAIMGFVILTTISTTVAVIFQCTPVDYYWKMGSGMEGRCIHIRYFWFTSAALNIASDIVIYLLPMPSFWRMKVSKRQRLGIVTVFGVGLFVVATGLLRLNSLRDSDDNSDPTWAHVSCGLWSEVELHVGIMCACMPSMKPLLARFFGKIQTPSGSSKLSSKVIKSDKGPHIRKPKEDTLDMIMKTENDLEMGGMTLDGKDGTILGREITLEKVDESQEEKGEEKGEETELQKAS